MDALPSRQERLRIAATAARDLLANVTTDRWEVFVKTSLTRHVEVAANRPPKVTEVDEFGIAPLQEPLPHAGLRLKQGRIFKVSDLSMKLGQLTCDVRVVRTK